METPPLKLGVTTFWPKFWDIDFKLTFCKLTRRREPIMGNFMGHQNTLATSLRTLESGIEADLIKHFILHLFS